MTRVYQNNTSLFYLLLLFQLQRDISKEFPKKHRLLSIALFALELVPIPYVEFIDEIWIRDIKDRPILRTALYAKADILLTGDKDFLESGINNLIIMNLAEFILLGKIDH